MKTHIVIALLLIASVFATGIALADQGRGADSNRIVGVKPVAVRAVTAVTFNPSVLSASTSASVEDNAGLEIGDVSDDDVTSVNNDVSGSGTVSTDVTPPTLVGPGTGTIGDSMWKAYPTVVIHGYGWAVSENTGYFARIVAVKQEFANSAKNNEITEIIKGKLRIGKDTLSFARKFTGTSKDLSGESFDVLKEGNVIGSLSFTTTKQLTGLTLLSGTIKLDDGRVFELTIAEKMEQREVRSVASKKGNEGIYKRPGQTLPVPAEKVNLQATCGKYSTDSKEYEACKLGAYKQYQDSVKSEKTTSRWEEWFMRFLGRDKKAEVAVSADANVK